MVPVWQKEHAAAQPTWLETQTVMRRAVGMMTDSIISPCGVFTRSLTVPSCARCTSSALSTGSGAVQFVSTLDGAHVLTVTSETGDVTFGGAVGGTTRIGALTVNTAGATNFINPTIKAASVTTDAPGTVAFTGGAVDTTGTQTYGEAITLGNNVTLTGSTVTFAGTVDGATAGGQVLAVTGGAVFGGAVGGTAALKTLSVSGATALNGGSVATTGAQTYTGAVTLGADTTLSTESAAISFASTLDGGHDLTVNNAGGDVTFGGVVGGTTRIGALAVDTAGATNFAASIKAASVTTDAAGTVTFAGGAVDTTGTQTYGEAITLDNNVMLTGSTVTFERSIDGAAAGQGALTVDGDAVFNDQIGTNAALKSLSVSGETFLKTGRVVTTGMQMYERKLQLFMDTLIESKNGSLTFGGTVDGTRPVNIAAAPAGLGIQAAGAAEPVALLSGLTIVDANNVTFKGDVVLDHLVQQKGQGLTRFDKTVTAAGLQGIQLTGTSFRFDKAATAKTGAITIATGDGNGTVTFGAAAPIKAATGFTQTGTGKINLGRSIEVVQGDITTEAVIWLTSSAAINTKGKITLPGIMGAGKTLEMNTGMNDSMEVGRSGGLSTEKLVVSKLVVKTTKSAKLYGSVNGTDGSEAATLITSDLVGPPWFINDTPWGPRKVPVNVSTPLTSAGTSSGMTDSLMASLSGTSRNSGGSIGGLGAARTPEVLSLGPSSASPVLPPSPGGAAGNPPALSAPAGNAPSGNAGPGMPGETGGVQGQEQRQDGSREQEQTNRTRRQ